MEDLFSLKDFKMPTFDPTDAPIPRGSVGDVKRTLTARPVEAPIATRSAKINPLPKGVRRKVYEKVCATAEMLYRRDGRIPDIDDIRVWTKYEVVTVSKVVSSREFVSRMARHGIRWEREGSLTSEQMLLLSYIVDPTVKLDLDAKLKRAGVPYGVYKNWLRNPMFAAEIKKYAHDGLTDHEADFNTVLTQKALSGDLNAIKFVYELTGKHDPQKQQMIDFQKIVMLLLEVITRHVRDPEALSAINQDVDKVIRGEIVRPDNRQPLPYNYNRGT